ncbi:MAG: porin [Planctomycetes bacterium]|nr:porin [Planctomycetota bacterium]
MMLREFAACLGVAIMCASSTAYGQLYGDQLVSDAYPAVGTDVIPAGLVQKSFGGGCSGCGAAGKSGSCGCDVGGKGKGSCCYLFGPDEPFELFSGIGGGHRGIDFGGWIQVGSHSSGVNGTGTGLFNNRPNQIQAHQMWAYLEKGVDTDGVGWDWGFRVDYMYGTDGQDTQAFGNSVDVNGLPSKWDNPWDHGSLVNGYGFAIPQAYIQIGRNDLTITAGHFYTIIGYEVVPAPDNFFYSHVRNMALNEPFTHHGVLGEWNRNECTTIWLGYVLGWDTGFDRNGGSAILAGISRQVTDRLKVISTLIWGDFGNDTGPPPLQGSDNDAYMMSTVIDWIVSDRIEIVAQVDYQNNTIGVGGRGKAWSLNNYLFYTFSDCLKAGVRGEWFNRGGNESGQLTAGFNYRPHANIVVRPEVRYDASDGGNGRRDTTLFGVDCIVIW